MDPKEFKELQKILEKLDKLPEKCYKFLLEQVLDNIDHHLNQAFINNECIYCDKNPEENCFECKNCGIENYHYYKDNGIENPKHFFKCSICKVETLNEKQAKKNEFWAEFRKKKYGKE